jgi:hypothetical protein
VVGGPVVAGITDEPMALEVPFLQAFVTAKAKLTHLSAARPVYDRATPNIFPPPPGHLDLILFAGCIG